MSDTALIPFGRFAELHGVTTRTLDRWIRLGILPEPVKIRRRKYYAPDTAPQTDKRTAASAEGTVS
jgi:DNA-binding transcriptional MerR regulator